MKKYFSFLLILLCVSIPVGCSNTAATVASSPALISDDMLAQGVFDALLEDWGKFDALSPAFQTLSSHLPGYCYKDFDDWNACVAFLGLSIPNPLETCTELEKGTYVAMPLGFADAPRIQASWYGTQEGHVEWLSVQAGYRDGPIRVVINAYLYTDPPEGKSTDGISSIELDRLWYLENTDHKSPLITEDSSENYTASTAYLAQGYVLYRVRVIGETDMCTEVQNTLEQALTYFSNAPA